MILKWIFDRVASLLELLILWPVLLLVVAILIKVKMPGGRCCSCRSVLDLEASCSTVISSAR